MLAAALSFATSKLGLSLIATVILITVIGAHLAGDAHVKHELADLRASDKAASDHAHLLEAQASKISDTARNTLDQRQAQIITRYKTLTVRLHDVAQNDADCRLLPSWIGLWNSAASDAPEVASGAR